MNKFKSAAKKVKVGAKLAAPVSAPEELKAKLNKLTQDQLADLFYKVRYA